MSGEVILFNQVTGNVTDTDTDNDTENGFIINADGSKLKSNVDSSVAALQQKPQNGMDNVKETCKSIIIALLHNLFIS